MQCGVAVGFQGTTGVGISAGGKWAEKVCNDSKDLGLLTMLFLKEKKYLDATCHRMVVKVMMEKGNKVVCPTSVVGFL